MRREGGTFAGWRNHRPVRPMASPETNLKGGVFPIKSGQSTFHHHRKIMS